MGLADKNVIYYRFQRPLHQAMVTFEHPESPLRISQTFSRFFSISGNVFQHIPTMEYDFPTSKLTECEGIDAFALPQKQGSHIRDVNPFFSQRGEVF